MKAVVIYKSKTGFAKKYAQWIAAKLSADLFEESKFDKRKLSDYDTIIFGGGLYAGGINGINLIKDNFDKMNGKKVIVYATGATPTRDNVFEEVAKKNFTSEQLSAIKFFYLRGGFNYDDLTFIDKILMTLLKAKLKMKSKKKNKMSPDERGMLAAYKTPVDFTKETRINSLIDYASSESE